MDKIVKLDDLANPIVLAYITEFDLLQPQHPFHYTAFQETYKHINIRHQNSFGKMTGHDRSAMLSKALTPSSGLVLFVTLRAQDFRQSNKICPQTICVEGFGGGNLTSPRC